MTLPLVPYEGRMSYCLIKCMQMVLAYQGHNYSLPWLECVSGEPFGFIYVRDGKQFFAVDGYVYHRAGEHLLGTLNYEYTYSSAPDDETALAALKEALRDGPVVAGMLDMGYLTYIPFHKDLYGTDHAIVVLALHPDEVIVHDPEGFPAMTLPLSDFLEAWKRDVYTGKPYGLWKIGAQGEPPSEESIWERTLASARESYAWTTEIIDENRTLIHGPEGMRALAADLRAFPERGLGPLPHFSWRVSAQRCLDSAFFVRDRLPLAAAIRWEESLIYGALQQASSAGRREAVSDLLERLAEHEERFIKALLG